jgi:phosphate transport system permease protein
MWFRRLLALFALLVPLVLLAIAVFLVFYAWPAIHYNGLDFLWRDTWNIGNQYASPIQRHGETVMPGAQFGILFLVAGTLGSALIALLFAFPLGLGAALFLSEAVPHRFGHFVSFFVELLAGIPSVVFGLWGIVFLIPFLSHHVYPVLARLFHFIPFLTRPIGSGYGLLTSSLVLCLMIVPFITATLRDALRSQSTEMREAGISLGATRFEVATRILLPGQKTALAGATMLAFGRALGETMAVLMVSGNALNYLPHNVYSPISTMAAFIVAQLDSALADPTGMAVRSLAEIAVLLLVISLITNGIARLLIGMLKEHTL